MEKERVIEAVKKANFIFRGGHYYAFASAKVGEYEFRAVKKLDGSVDFLILPNKVEVTLPYWDKGLVIEKIKEEVKK